MIIREDDAFTHLKATKERRLEKPRRSQEWGDGSGVLQTPASAWTVSSSTSEVKRSTGHVGVSQQPVGETVMDR